MLSPSQFWFFLGVILVLAEFVVPGFIICFFGVAAWIVAGMLWLWPDLSLGATILVFAGLAVLLLLASRKFLPKTFRGRTSAGGDDPDDDAVVGSVVTVVEPIEPDKPGKVEFHGTKWSAGADQALSAGTRVTIVRRDNLVLFVKPLHA